MSLNFNELWQEAMMSNIPHFLQQTWSWNCFRGDLLVAFRDILGLNPELSWFLF